jgi:hypothetical protein
MLLDRQGPEVVEFLKNSQIKSKDISLVKIQLINMFQHWIICKLQVPIMRVLNTPCGAVFGELAVINFNFGFRLNIFAEFLWVSSGIVIDPEHFEAEVIEFFNDLVDFVFSELIRHEGQRYRVWWEL